MRTVDRVLAFLCAVTTAFALAFAAGRLVGPVGPGVDPPPAPPATTVPGPDSPSSGHGSGDTGGH